MLIGKYNKLVYDARIENCFILIPSRSYRTAHAWYTRTHTGNAVTLNIEQCNNLNYVRSSLKCLGGPIKGKVPYNMHTCI